MWAVFKRLLLGIILIVLASSALLFSDLNRRIHPRKDQEKADSGELGKKWRILIAMLVEAPPMEESHQGIQEGLKQSGLVEGRDYELTTRNAQGDMATLNNVLDTAASENYDLIFTMTTPALQTAINKIKDKPVIFTLAVNPASWGGVKSDREHPANITGVYLSNPFQRMIDVIRECFPRAKKIGTLFSPGESNSVYVKEVFSDLTAKNSLDLVAIPVNSSVEVSEATGTLVTRGVDVICQLGDNVTSAAFPSIISVADKAKLPLFAFSTYHIKQGALVAVANDHFDGGREAALLAARVMRGETPGNIPLQPARTLKIAVNLDTAKKHGFTLPQSLISIADEVVGKRAESRTSKKWNIQLVEYTNILDVEDSEKGIREGFKESGLLEGRDYILKVRNAQGDMVTLSTMVDAAITDGADMLMTMSTPTLQAAIHRAGKRPIVFTLVASAIAAGAGRTNEDHLANVTGVVTTSAYEELMAALRECMPQAKRVGTLFVPSEPNSIYNMERTKEAAKKFGMDLVVIPAHTSADVPDAALSLMSRNIDAVCQIAGNLTASSFPSLVHAAKRVPIFAFQSNQAYEGASVVVARDYYDGGREAAHIAARILRGEDPSKIPFQPLKTTRILINQKAAEKSGLKIPQSLLKRAAKVINQ